MLVPPTMTARARLAELSGIQRSYTDIYGKEQSISDAGRDALLAAMGFDLSDVAVNRLVDTIENARARRLVAPVSVQRESNALSVVVTAPRGSAIRWQLVEESGASHSGEVSIDRLPREGEVQNNGQTLIQARLELPQLAIGYHALNIATCDRVAQHRLIVAPRSCYVPPSFHRGQRGWGAAVQLYALRGQTSWGIGDYGDLTDMARMLGSAGAAFVGVSPLHASFPSRPEQKSPYSPSSRLFLNWLYIDIAQVTDYVESPEARAFETSDAVRRELDRVRSSELVDYPAVAKLKRRVLELAYVYFRNHCYAADTPRGARFRAFKELGGERLRLHALNEALQEHLGSDEVWGWPVWPEAYRDPGSPEVSAFAVENEDRVDFFIYLQWLADGQLVRAAETAKGSGMAVGLYVDLAVGVDRGGSETWANRESYAADASVGAPPDDLAPKGQNWGLPPLVPERLQEDGYAPFIATLQRCMKSAGALRMDHVMGLMRLFWVPPGDDATEGGYVHYPFRDMLGILALESVRNQCLVIGEDLGTVPNEMRGALAEHDVLSYRVFYFENDGDRPKPPEAYPPCALVTVGTHDLATLKGFWEERDLQWRAELKLYPTQGMRQHFEHQRNAQKARMIEVLKERGLIRREGFPLNAALPQELTVAVYAYIARAPCWLLSVQLEDVLNVIEQPNLPGTVDEHPNWQRRLPATVSQIGASQNFVVLAETLRREGR
ncbi:MAG: 4-alpha-glucanotransferase [Clostridia bacterium]|nr:4-alpha-glucanotransferase [Deltaproteobacteria bacterium]